MTSASRFKMLRVPMILSAASSYTTHSRSRKTLGLTIAVDKVAREVRLSAPGVIAKALQRFAPHSTSVARSPAVYQPPRFGAAAHTPDTPDTSPSLNAEEHHNLQQLGGVLLYYCLAIDSTGLPAVTAIESALSNATQLTQRAADRLLAYFRNYPDNILVLKACDMRLHTQSDASYGTRSRGRSVAGGIAYLGNADPTAINGPIMQLFKTLWLLSEKQNMLLLFIPLKWPQDYEKICLTSAIPNPPHTSSSITQSPPASPATLSNLSVRKVLTCSFIGYAIVYR
jgi:hypothetical protein